MSAFKNHFLEQKNDPKIELSNFSISASLRCYTIQRLFEACFKENMILG